jgi:hypothetical protein
MKLICTLFGLVLFVGLMASEPAVSDLPAQEKKTKKSNGPHLYTFVYELKGRDTLVQKWGPTFEKKDRAKAEKQLRRSLPGAKFKSIDLLRVD